MKTPADLILTNGMVRTQEPGCPRAEAVAVANGRILSAGSNAEADALAGPHTQRIDLEGRLVLPGFIDSHFHYHQWALNRVNLDLSDAADLKEVLRRVKNAAAQKKPGHWILGFRFNECDWPENRIPTGRDLDMAAPDHPVALWRCDLHLATVNSAALAAAGIDENTTDPDQGVIDRDADGRPSGILRELAVNLVKNVIPEPSLEDTVTAMKNGMAELHALGITGLHDIRLMGGAEGAVALSAWQVLHRNGDLGLRCWVSLPGERLDEAVALGLRSGFGDDRMRIGLVKFFADGGMGARTAWMLDPYLDAGYGMPLTPMDDLRAGLEKAERAGLAVAIHTIGDRANRELVEIFESVLAERGASSSLLPPVMRHRMEHLQLMRPEDLARLSKLPVAACVQPPNLPLDIDMIDASVGPRGKFAYAFRDMLDSGMAVCFSSDCPVCDPDPLAGIQAAVTRSRRDGTPGGGWYPHQRVKVAEAVRAYTLTPAEISGAAGELGGIRPGKRADLAVLDHDIYSVDPMDIGAARVEMTIFDGRVVYQRKSSK
jgi:predicted amidohydrolase YtcJ